MTNFYLAILLAAAIAGCVWQDREIRALKRNKRLLRASLVNRRLLRASLVNRR